ncbi:hypothetical protein QQS21_009741 [Conoideocrella luteorostrata]|uniref:Uncharacterized protein n=1 Tax=Conoideocrella luteorostrata TaxID=1105319 RepID=A0AAJ0CGG3_9HYPO|nr:hypothetical protein QQS21_009741 [Conoideocrella luteorostrata]
MPSVKNWATSFAKTSSRDTSCRRRSSVAESYVRRISETSLSNMDVNDSERTLVDTLEVEDMQPYDVCQQRRESRASSATASHQNQHSAKEYKGPRSIERRVDYCVVEDDRCAVQFGNYTGVWAGSPGSSVPQKRSRYFGDHIHQNAYNMSHKA